MTGILLVSAVFSAALVFEQVDRNIERERQRQREREEERERNSKEAVDRAERDARRKEEIDKLKKMK